MKLHLATSTSFRLTALLAAALACAACAAPGGDDESTDSTKSTDSEDSTETTRAALSRGGLGLDGDSCTVRIKSDGTKVPGTEKDGSCCSNSDPNDCVIILKPFPGVSFSRAAL